MSRVTKNAHFYSNACHVCRVYGNTVELKRCAGCKTIAYCSREHQSQDWPEHKELCKLLTEMTKRAGTIFAKPDERDTSVKCWTRTKTNLMLLVQLKLGRKLQHYEEEMFKFPRSCAICHETNFQRLVDCKHCPGTSFCSDHERNDAHAIHCETLKLCFETETSPLSLTLEDQKIMGSFRGDDVPKSMSDIVDACVFPCNKNARSKMLAAQISEYLTRPLTLFYALEQLRASKTTSMNVLVIGANAMETESLAYWETLLHCERSLDELRLVLVGPELRPRMYEMNLCDECTAKNVRLRIRTVDELYDDYANGEYFAEPDYAIGFNLGIHECEDISSPEDTWAPSIKKLSRLDCPFVMTSYTLQESRDERGRIDRLLDNRVEPLYSGKNPFSSVRPYRDFETEHFFYQNNYVTIYEKLR